MLDQRRRRWADVVQMIYKCFVFDGKSLRYAASLTCRQHCYMCVGIRGGIMDYLLDGMLIIQEVGLLACKLAV